MPAPHITEAEGCFTILWKKRGQGRVWNASKIFGYHTEAEAAFQSVRQAFLRGNDMISASDFHRKFRGGDFYLLELTNRFSMPEIPEEEISGVL